MTRIFWDTIFLISGSLFTFGAGPSNTTVMETGFSAGTKPSAAPNSSTSDAALDPTTDLLTAGSSLFTLAAGQTESDLADAANSTDASFSDAPSISPSGSAPTTPTTTATTTTTKIPTVKKFVAAAVRSHFDDCPDSHRHFCFHGTCRFLILEETPACVCHQGFVGMRCEHADLLAVVATNHRQQTVATMLVLCVIGCVLIMVLCTILHCWWRQDCRRRRHAHHYGSEKHGASCYPPESVV